MSHHFSNSSHKEKIPYDNFKSAILNCNKYNSKIANIGKKKRVPYLCKICQKVHIGSDFKKIITFKVQENALNKVNKTISKSVLINRIKI